MIDREAVKNNRIIRRSYYFMRGLTRRGKLARKAEKTLEAFGVELSSEAEKAKLIADMLRMNRLYGYGFDEYLYYHFSERPLQERLAFIADWEHLGYTCAMNNPRNADVFDNKWKTFKNYKAYYRRDVAFCEGQEGESVFSRFLEVHPDCIVKPLDASCGRGVRIVHTEQAPEAAVLYAEILDSTKGRFIVEELIRQTAETAKFHPASVNTVRVPTIKDGNTVHIVHPFFRIGQHGNHVDNAGSGGIICVLDADTGRVLGAADEFGRSFVVHPDTGEQLLGYTIPRWEEAKALVSELAGILPDNRYTGWDLALTDAGWLLVEANRRGQFVWQIPMQRGTRDEINQYLRNLGVKY